jgi:hypothetical protein
MHRTLQQLERSSAICGELEPCDSLAVALTCQGLLEPALDSLWREIYSFPLIIGCMPDDLWRREERTIAGEVILSFGHSYLCPGTSFVSLGRQLFRLGTDSVLGQFPCRPLTPKDLNRYMRFYAKRIRHIEWRISIEDPVFPIEGLLALQIATDRIPGALTPLIQFPMAKSERSSTQPHPPLAPHGLSASRLALYATLPWAQRGRSRYRRL